MLRFRFKACIKCCGDLALDDGDWICLQCGTYYYVGLYQGAPTAGLVARPIGGPVAAPVGIQGRRGEDRNKGSAIVSSIRSETWDAFELTTGAPEPELIRQ